MTAPSDFWEYIEARQEECLRAEARKKMSRIERRFWAFHEENPRVYELFQYFTFTLIQRGWKHHSSDAVLHRIRWQTAIETTDPQFKINDHYSAYYARLFMRDHPEHVGFFRTRELRDGDESDALKPAEAAE